MFFKRRIHIVSLQIHSLMALTDLSYFNDSYNIRIDENLIADGFCLLTIQFSDRTMTKMKLSRQRKRDYQVRKERIMHQ